MLRPTISNRTIKLRARRTSPTRPALLVGPSRLLRGDKVRDSNVNGPRDQSPECGLLVAITVFITQSATSNRQGHPDGGRLYRVEYLSHLSRGRLRHPTEHPSSVHIPDAPCGSLAPPIGLSLHFLATGAKEESKAPKPLDCS